MSLFCFSFLLSLSFACSITTSFKRALKPLLNTYVAKIRMCLSVCSCLLKNNPYWGRSELLLALREHFDNTYSNLETLNSSGWSNSTLGIFPTEVPMNVEQYLGTWLFFVVLLPIAKGGLPFIGWEAFPLPLCFSFIVFVNVKSQLLY